MRLWAALDTITFGEYVPRMGETVEPSFHLALSYLGPIRAGGRPRFSIDLGALGETGLVQVPELGRTHTALTGELSFEEGEAPGVWRVRSALTLRLNAPQKGTLGRIADLARSGDRPACQALGTLSIAGRELRTRGDALQPARVLRFQSLCLRTRDPRFGQWVDVARYADLGSDPDVIGAPVLVVELEILP